MMMMKYNNYLRLPHFVTKVVDANTSSHKGLELLTNCAEKFAGNNL
jgi:hypothetical protein